MLPMVEVPETIKNGMLNYRDVFFRDEGSDHVSRYVIGSIVSPNKALQGIYNLQVWGGKKPSRRTMYEPVFQVGWDSEALIQRHRAVVAPDHRGRGREVISLDWTFAHHDRGPEIYGAVKSYDYVEKRPGRFQTVVTAVISNKSLIDGLDTVVQEPSNQKEGTAYFKETAKRSYDQMESVSTRLLELLHYLKHERGYKKRTEIALELVQQIEEGGNFPDANYAFDNGVLSLALTRYIEACGKQWVSELECSRNIQWSGNWVKLDALATESREKHPESSRLVKVTCRNDETKEYWAFTKTVRLKRYGHKRLVIVHETWNLSDPPRYLLTSAEHWNSGRTIQTWSYKWSSEVFHEFTNRVPGLESSQIRRRKR